MTDLAELESQLRSDPTRIRVLLPAVARLLGRSGAPVTDLAANRVEDRHRVRLLVVVAEAWAGAGPGRGFAEELADLYRFGDADERRAVVMALPELDGVVDLQDVGTALVQDALRTNDPRLVLAAMGAYGAARLEDAPWRQGVLKCLFIGVPLGLVAGVGGADSRVDDELRTMVAAYVTERTAAGRSVPGDARMLLEPAFPTSTDTTAREL